MVGYAIYLDDETYHSDRDRGASDSDRDLRSARLCTAGIGIVLVPSIAASAALGASLAGCYRHNGDHLSKDGCIHDGGGWRARSTGSTTFTRCGCSVHGLMNASQQYIPK